MLASMKKLLCGAAFFITAVLPAFAGGYQPLDYPKEAHATQTTVTVNIVWLKSYDSVDVVCNLLDGVFPPPNDGTMIVGCFDPRDNTIYAVQPRNFNDSEHLEILGHEFWHALGALHP